LLTSTYGGDASEIIEKREYYMSVEKTGDAQDVAYLAILKLNIIT